MKPFGIIIIGHMSPIHFEAVQESNPGVPIYIVNTHGMIESVKVFDPHAEPGVWSWKNSDLSLYAFRLMLKNEPCEKWAVLEWDTYCNMDLKEYFRLEWDSHLVVCNVEMDESWCWFKEARFFPAALKRYACGVWPLGLMLISDVCLKHCATNVDPWCLGIFCELRLGTMANMIQTPTIKRNATISWKGEFTPFGNGIWHPVKRAVK